MPIEFSIDRNRALTVFTLRGEVALSEFVRVLNAYGKSKPTRFELYDARELTGRRLTTQQMQSLAGYLRKHAAVRPAGSKTVVVVSQTIDFGLSRMVALLTDGQVPFSVDVCDTIEEAYRVLEEP